MPNPTPARDAVDGANGARFYLSDAATNPSRYLTEREAHLMRMSESASPSLASEARNALVWFRADITAARADERERVKREAVDILNAMREEGESDLRQARARIEGIV